MYNTNFETKHKEFHSKLHIVLLTVSSESTEYHRQPVVTFSKYLVIKALSNKNIGHF